MKKLFSIFLCFILFGSFALIASANTFEDAEPYTVGSTKLGALTTENPSRYYKFTINESGSYTIKLVGETATLKAQIYDFEHSIIGNLNGTEQKTFTGIISGTYYIKISDATDHTEKPIENYSFEVQLNKADGSEDVTVKPAESSVKYVGNADAFVFIPESTDLFQNMKDLMPGDTVYQDIIVGNSMSGKKVTIYMRAEPVEPQYRELLSFMNLTVYNNGQIISDSLANMQGNLKNDICLGTFSYGDHTTLKAKLHVSPDMGNRYAESLGKIVWVFTVGELEDEPVTDYESTTEEDSTLPGNEEQSNPNNDPGRNDNGHGDDNNRDNETRHGQTPVNPHTGISKLPFWFVAVNVCAVAGIAIMCLLKNKKEDEDEEENEKEK